MKDLQKFDSTKIMQPLSQQDLGALTPEAYLNSLTPEQIGLLFSQLDKIEKFFSDVRKIIEKEVKEGAKVPGLQVVLAEQKSSEGFIASDAEVAKKLRAMGYSDEAIWKEPSLVSWSNMKNMIKTAGVKELKEAGLVGAIKKEPKEIVVYVEPDTIVNVEEKKEEK